MKKSFIRISTTLALLKEITGPGCVSQRESFMESYLNALGIPFEFYHFYGAKSCTVKWYNDKVRIFCGSGFGRWNYAFCFEISREFVKL